MKPVQQPLQNKTRRETSSLRLSGILTLLLTVTLTACSTIEADTTHTLSGHNERFDRSLTVSVAPGAERAAIETQYGGRVVVWHPEEGFAILGLQDTGGLQTLGADNNRNVFKAPEIKASGINGSGRSAWSGGRSAWSGGRSAWSGGRSAWSGGKPTTFVENLSYWDQVDLPEGQTLAPRLGAGVKVAVIDTGIDLRHPAFAGKLAPSSEWKDFIDNDNYPQEVSGSNYGHGTGVADVIVQVAPNVTILPLRVLDGNGVGDTDDVNAAIGLGHSARCRHHQFVARFG